MALDTDASTSPPRSLRITVPASTGSYPDVGLSRSETTLAAQVHIALDVRISGKIPPQKVTPVWLRLTTPPAGPGLNGNIMLRTGPSAADIHEDLFGADGGNWARTNPLTAYLVGDRWWHVEIDLKLDSPRIKITFRDDTGIETTAVDVPLLPQWAKAMPTLVLVPTDYPPVDGYAVDFDNVVYDLKP